MTIRSQLSGKLPRVTSRLLAQTGVAATLFSVVTTRAADNSASQSWHQEAAGVPILPDAMSDAQLIRIWGDDVKANLTGYVAMGVSVTVGMVVQFTAGSFAGRSFEVVRQLPDDVSGIRTLALAEVPAKPVI